jgi:hypothetical protein
MQQNSGVTIIPMRGAQRYPVPLFIAKLTTVDNNIKK